MNNGDIVRTREVQTYSAGIPIPVATRQILYRSTDLKGTPLVTATTVLTPGIPGLAARGHLCPTRKRSTAPPQSVILPTLCAQDCSKRSISSSYFWSKAWL